MITKKIEDVIRNYYHIIRRNKISLNGNKLRLNQINLEWWDLRTNIGDCLAPVIYDYLLENFKLEKNRYKKKNIQLLTIGSIVGMAPYDATIWGSGIHTLYTAKSIIDYSKITKLDVRATRGPITEFILESAGYKCTGIYGDPAILMPLIYKPEVSNTNIISVIPHIGNKDILEYVKGLNYIDVRTNNYKKFIDEICSSKLVISSSLHGIILAESYGIPAIFLSYGMEEEKMKFLDWYYSTNRYDIRMANTIGQALQMQPMEIPDLTLMRQTLIESFPRDLWD